MKNHRRDIRLKVCRDIANALKHFKLDPPNQAKAVTASVVSTSGFGLGRYGVGAYGTGEESIRLALANSHKFDLLTFCSEVTQLWETYFQRHGA